MPASDHPELSDINHVAECFVAASSKPNGIVELAYRELETQTDRQFAELTNPLGPYRLSVVDTCLVTPYASDRELIDSVRDTRTLEVPTSGDDRSHPLLGGAAGTAYYRFRAVHDLVGHVATGYGFDRDGEYSAWEVQRCTYSGLGRWAAATELLGEISVLFATHQFADHKAALLDRQLLRRLRRIPARPQPSPDTEPERCAASHGGGRNGVVRA